VINPIIDSLARELALLSSGNLTWRNTTQRCEMIRTIQEYVDPIQWPNYQDFRAEYPRSGFIPGFKKHDSGVEDLNKVAQVRFSRMFSWPQFQAFLNEALTIYENSEVSKSPQVSLSTNVRQDIPKIVAELLINNASELPSHYLVSQFWNSAGRSRLTPLRDFPAFQPLHQTTRGLLEISAKLKMVLETFRLSLSREYDLPAAPVPGPSFEN
jgi:hypothetical protein